MLFYGYVSNDNIIKSEHIFHFHEFNEEVGKSRKRIINLYKKYIVEKIENIFSTREKTGLFCKPYLTITTNDRAKQYPYKNILCSSTKHVYVEKIVKFLTNVRVYSNRNQNKIIIEGPDIDNLFYYLMGTCILRQ